MRRILPNNEALRLFDVAQTRAIEQAAMAALPPHALMGRAGLATAQGALALAPHAARVWIAAGPGNNGGDGLEAAGHLARWGKQVEVALFGDAASLPDDAKHALVRAQAAGVRIQSGRIAPDDAPALAIDALFGIGASRAPQGAIAETVRGLNALPCPVLAIDLPSGLNADTGQPLGDACVIATHTLALLTLKPGLFTGAGRDHAGAIWLDDLGADTAGATPCAWLTGRDDAEPPARQHAQHKGSFGDLAVVGGASGMAGAALLAARAALAAGAGRVFVSARCEPPIHLDPSRPELMFRADWPGADPHPLAHTTVVCGCGGGLAVREALPRLLSAAPRLVLDADALNAIAADAMLQTLLQARAGRGLASVLTPHPLEAARLSKLSTAEVQANRIAAAQALADRFRCTVLLKGSGTVVASAGCVPAINPTGNASLASPGTGDVLAGWLGGMWAQWIGALPQAEPASIAHRSAVAAAYAHGAAADGTHAGPLRASELIERLHTQRQAPLR